MTPITRPAVPCPRCGNTLPPNAPEGLCPRCLGALNLTGETAFTGAASPQGRPLSPEELAPHFPQLTILECLGRGGMGVVYKARQKSLGRLVALKLLAPEREKDAQFAERFAREAQALAALSHPHIVTVYDFGQTNGFFFLLMEFVDGVNLRQLLEARKLTPEEALAIVPQLCDALEFAHARGIVHRDIKPENLLLDKHGRVRIADFGIARMLNSEGLAPEEPVTGTPGYMAPEQRETPQRVDSRADIYSLGVVFYEMLTGELPAKELQAPSRKVSIDVRLDDVVLRALEKAPELRWQTAAEIRTRVETIAAKDRAVGGAAADAWQRVYQWATQLSARPWNPKRQPLFWILLLLLAYPLARFNLLTLESFAPAPEGPAYGIGRAWGIVLLSTNVLILCLALDFALVRSLWEWGHTASDARGRIWVTTRRWWGVAIACMILLWIFLPSAPRTPPSIALLAPTEESANAEPLAPETVTARIHESATAPEATVPILSDIPFVGRLFRSDPPTQSEAGNVQAQAEPTPGAEPPPAASAITAVPATAILATDTLPESTTPEPPRLLSPAETLRPGHDIPAERTPTAPETANPAQWLHGKWVFDEEFTQQKYAVAKSPEGLNALKEGLVFPQLVEKLKGAQLLVTDKEVTMITGDGNGKAFTYKVLEARDGNSVTLKQSDGDITTYHQDGERFWISSIGNVNLPFYFKRAK